MIISNIKKEFNYDKNKLSKYSVPTKEIAL